VKMVWFDSGLTAPMKTISQVIAAAAKIGIDVYQCTLHDDSGVMTACTNSEVSYDSLKQLTEIFGTTKIDICSDLGFPGSETTAASSELQIKIRW